MKVTIQTLKAPWPEGAKVGDVVAFEGDTAPAWAVGKFAPAADNAEADFYYKPKLSIENGSGQALPSADTAEARTRAREEAAEALARQVAARQAFSELEAERDQALQQRDAAQADLAAALDREAALLQQLDAAQAPAPRTRENLNAQAEKLGVKVDGRWSDERLTEEIAKATKK